MGVESRLARLERGVRVWRTTGIASFVLLAIAFGALVHQHRELAQEVARPPAMPATLVAGHVAAGTISANKIRADIFEVGGFDGPASGGLMGGDSSGAVLWLGKIGEGQISMAASRERGLTLSFVDRGSTRRIGVSLDPDGLTKIALTGLAGGDPVTLATGPAGDGYITVRDRGGRVRVVTAED